MRCDNNPGIFSREQQRSRHEPNLRPVETAEWDGAVCDLKSLGSGRVVQPKMHRGPVAPRQNVLQRPNRLSARFLNAPQAKQIREKPDHLASLARVSHRIGLNHFRKVKTAAIASSTASAYSSALTCFSASDARNPGHGASSVLRFPLQQFFENQAQFAPVSLPSILPGRFVRALSKVRCQFPILV